MSRTRQQPETVIDHLKEQGFQDGPPPHVSHWAIQIDRQAAWESSCPCCAAYGMTYHAMHQDRDYRAVARCESCGHELEF